MLVNCPECKKEMDEIYNPELKKVVGHYCVDCKIFVEARDYSGYTPVCYIGLYSNDEVD